jgi:hypothetical protein
MYSRDDIKSLIKMIETGILKLDESNGVSVVGTFGLEEWKKAFQVAKSNAQMGQTVLFTP